MRGSSRGPTTTTTRRRRAGRPGLLFAASALEPRLLLATIGGQVWNDADGDGRQDFTDRGQGGWTVYVDLNANGSPDGTDPSAVSDGSGNYSITSAAVRTGTFSVRTVPQAGWRPTAPATGEQSVTLFRLGDDATGVDFGVTRRALVRGTVFHDVDENGVQDRDRSESGQPGRTVFADADNDGVLDAGEVSAATEADGDYALALPAGSHTIRQVQQPGWWQTAPQPQGAGHAVTVSDAQVVSNRDFGNVVATVDLLGAGFAITSAFDPVPAGGRVDVLYQVRNNGTADSAGFRVAFYLSDDETITTGDTLVRSIASGSVPRHSTQDRTTTLNLPDSDPLRTDNRYWVGMIVDELNEVAETNEANNSNQGVLADRYPVSSEADLPSPADHTNVLARPIAVGGQATGFIGDEWIGLYDQDIYRLQVSAGHNLNIVVDGMSEPAAMIRLFNGNWSLRKLSVGTLEYTVPANDTYYVVISGGGNGLNDPRRVTGRTTGPTGAYTLSVGAANSDLAGGVSVSGGPPGTVTATFTVTHPFTFDPPSFDVALYLSDDEVITTADRFLGTARVTSDHYNYSTDRYTLTADFTPPAVDPFRTDNEYFFGVIIDSSNEVPESNETNNTGATSRQSERNLRSPADGGGPISYSLPSFGNPAEGEVGDEWIGPYDQDVFQTRANAGERLRFDIDTDGSGLNSYVRIFDGSWTFLAGNDDGRAPGELAGSDSYLEHLFDADTTVWVVISGSGNHTNDPLRLVGRSAASTGTYELTITSVPAGPVTGVVFDDANANGVRDAGETGLGGWNAYLGSPDSDLRFGQPPGALTDATGQFSITSARPDTYGLRVVPLAGWLRTAPAQQASHVVALTSGQPAGPFEFGFVRAASVAGAVFDDLDSDGARDAGEAGLAGWTVYLDANNNGVRDQATLDFPVTGLDDPGDTTSRVRVPADLFARVIDVDVFVNASINTDGDFTVLHEGFALVRLATDVETSLQATFDDEASSGQGTFGRRRPEAPLSALDGAQAEGVWVLDANIRSTVFGISGGTLRAWTLRLTVGEPAAVTDAAGNYTLAGVVPGDRRVRVVPGNPDDWSPTAPAGGEHALALAPGEAAAGKDFATHLRRLRVEGRHLFYNNSAFDGRSAAAGPADDAAIATDKRPLTPGGGAAFEHYSSSSKGMNGLMVDVDELRGTLTAGDFAFHVPSPFDPSQWVPAPAPTGFAVRPLDVPGSPDRRRVTFTWPDGLVRNTWLRVTVLANANTRRLAPDVFLFGNLVGEVGDRAIVTHRDVAAVRMGLSTRPQPVDSRLDIDRDGKVTALDIVAVRQNLGRVLSGPVLPAVVTIEGAPPLQRRPGNLLNEETALL